MNNEPVAWMYEKSNGASKLSFVKEKMLWEDMTETPLYTHPKKDLANALTDKEITDLWCEVYDFKGYDCLTKLDYKFCREIIRKAQEK